MNRRATESPITAHPCFEEMSDERLKLNENLLQTEIDDTGDPLEKAHLETRMQLLQAERARRNGNGNSKPKEAPGGMIEQLSPFSDLANARRFASIHGGNILYSKQRGKWITWTGHRWQWDETGRIFDFATAVIQSIYGEAADHPDKDMRELLAAHAVRSESRGKIDNMLALAQGLPEIRTELERFDHDLNMFGCLESAVNLSIGKSQWPKREAYMTLQSPVKFDQGAECPRWYQFIDEITQGHVELAQFLQRAVGYSLTGTTTEQCFFLLFGTSSNGKSTFINTILELMGDYGCQVKTEVLLESRYEQKDYHLAELCGKRFVAACESNMRRQLAASLLKQATGSDLLIARRPFEKPFNFRPQFKLWLSTNARPRVDDPSDAMWRRIHAIPFGAKFIKKEDGPKGYKGPFRRRQPARETQDGTSRDFELGGSGLPGVDENRAPTTRQSERGDQAIPGGRGHAGDLYR